MDTLPDSEPALSFLTFCLSVLLIVYCTTRIVGPLTYPPTEAPLFQTGFKITLIALIVSIFLVFIYTYLGWKENRRRDALGAVASVDHSFNDLTDKRSSALLNSACDFKLI